jgi:SAM-dependent methyltransferase
VADINTTQTTDVDVETLMDRIRRRVYGLPDAGYIMGEIERVRLSADAVVTGRIEKAGPKDDSHTPVRSRPKGWKVAVKSRIAMLIMRAVRLNFRFQTVFNNSVVDVLQLMAEDLYAYERRLNIAGGLSEIGRAPEGAFNRAAYEERHLDQKPFCLRSVSLFREHLREGDVALELFCGRSELLAAFAENGIEALGVDPDAEMVSLCRERGLHALHGDIFEHLRGAPDASFGGIFAARVVERLTNDQTAGLLELAGRKLRRGGLFVASATNVDHLPSLTKFYMDPSLVRPVPAKLLGFMVERSKLRIHQFRFSDASAAEQGSEDLSVSALSTDVYPYDEYTIVAVNN